MPALSTPPTLAPAPTLNDDDSDSSAAVLFDVTAVEAAADVDVEEDEEEDEEEGVAGLPPLSLKKPALWRLHARTSWAVPFASSFTIMLLQPNRTRSESMGGIEG